VKDVSALMDGELDRRHARSTITRVEGEDDLRDAWATFHVIRDALQGNAVAPSRFVERFHERLEQEPVPAVSRWRTYLPRPRPMLLGSAAMLLALGLIAWFSGAGWWSGSSGRSQGPSVPAPFVDGGLNDSVAIEYAMAHRQLVPAFVSDAAPRPPEQR
jgi:hypothetical protein